MKESSMVDNTPGTNNPGGVEKLSTAECWSLLEHARLGRLALSDAMGEPELFPVNFTSNEGFLYIRTANDSKLRHLRMRSEEHTSELQSLMRISYAVFCLKK